MTNQSFLSNIGGFRNRGRYCFLFCNGPILNDIRGHSDPKNIWQIARNRIQFFKLFSREAPRPPPALAPLALGLGLRPLTAPFQNSWIRPCTSLIVWTNFAKICPSSSGDPRSKLGSRPPTAKIRRWVGVRRGRGCLRNARSNKMFQNAFTQITTLH